MRQIFAFLLVVSIYSINDLYSQNLHGSLKVFSYIKGCHGACNYSFGDNFDINDCGSEKDSIIEVINIFRVNGTYYINGRLITPDKADRLLSFIDINKIKIVKLLDNVSTENNAVFIPPMASCFQFEEYQFCIDRVLISYIVLDGDKNENGSFLESKDLEIFDQLKTLIK